MLWQINELVLLVVFLAGFLCAVEAGFWFGVRRKGPSIESDKAHIGALQAAVLGLLALLLGFTFFMAVSRFDLRQALVVDEANAIGTAHLRVRFLPVERRDAAEGLIRQYVAARLSFYTAGINPTQIEKANVDATRIQRQLWNVAGELTALQPSSISAGMLAESLNALIDVQEKRQAALDNHVPETVIYLLLVVSLAALGLVGYGCGLTRRRRIVSSGLFGCLVLLVLATILDIDRPRRGLIEVSQESLVRLQASLERETR